MQLLPTGLRLPSARRAGIAGAHHRDNSRADREVQLPAERTLPGRIILRQAAAAQAQVHAVDLKVAVQPFISRTYCNARMSVEEVVLGTPVVESSTFRLTRRACGAIPARVDGRLHLPGHPRVSASTYTRKAGTRFVVGRHRRLH